MNDTAAFNNVIQTYCKMDLHCQSMAPGPRYHKNCNSRDQCVTRRCHYCSSKQVQTESKSLK